MQTWEEAAKAQGWKVFIDLPTRTEFRNDTREDDFVTDAKCEVAWQELCEFMGIRR